MSQTPEELAQKIREAQEKQREPVSPADMPGNKGSAPGKAFRMATDLVAALFVGGFMGYWIDRGLGTKPWMMILFLFVGFAAGFMNIYRSQTGQDFKIGFRDASRDAAATKEEAPQGEAKEKE